MSCGSGTGVSKWGVVSQSMRPFFVVLKYVGLAACLAPTLGCDRRSPPVAAPIREPKGPSVSLSVEEAERLVRLSPNDPRSQVALARAVRRIRPADSARALRTALRLDPGSEEAYRELASLYEEKGYTDRLLELLEARLRLRPDDLDALFRSSALYSLVDARAQAEAALVRAARVSSDDPRLMPARLIFEYQTGRFAEGIALAQQHLARRQNDHTVYYHLSELQRASEKFVDAEKSIRTAIQLKPNEPSYHRQLGHILATATDKTRMHEAEKEARRAIDLGDRGIDARYWLAVTLDNQRRDKEAIAAYQEVAKEDVRYDKTAYRLGRLYQQNGRTEEGAKLLGLYGTMDKNRKLLGEAVERLRKHPEKPESYGRLAAIYQDADDPGTAVLLLRYALRRFPNDTSILSRLRKALLDAGRVTESTQISNTKKQ